VNGDGDEASRFINERSFINAAVAVAVQVNVHVNANVNADEVRN
jgi:hypothetical protein